MARHVKLFVAALPAAALALTCRDAPLRSMKYCDSSLPIPERVGDLLQRLTPSQLMGQMEMVGAAVPELGMEEFNYGGEALHGVWSTCAMGANRTACPTQFPTPVTMGASFNRHLWRAMADVTSTEARALYAYNLQLPNGTEPAKSLEGPLGLCFYTPNVNILRDARWGRAEEVPSEDPAMNAEYADAFVQGFQHGSGSEEGARPYLKAIAIVKHFVAYNLEVDEAHHLDRHSFDAAVSVRDLMESYTPAFEAAATSGAGGIMCSYNAVNGEPACTGEKLLKGLLRGSFGFKGVVATDCGALRDAHLRHKRYPTAVATVTAAVHAGVDSNCGQYFKDALPWALGNGTLGVSDLAGAAERLLTARFQLGLFEPEHPDVPKYGLQDVDSQEHRNLALEAARQGIVLLKNAPVLDTPAGGKQPLLPLNKHKDALKKLAVIGPNANATRNLLAGYHGTPPFTPVSALAALRLAWPHGPEAVSYAVGCTVSGMNETQENLSIAEAVSSTREADLVVLVLGLCGNNYAGEDPSGVCPRSTETEGMDRASLTLPGSQLNLLMQVAATGKPIVLVMVNAGPVDLTWAKSYIPAIIWAGYGGQSGGTAIADALLGNFNPGGALPYTVYPQKHADMAPFWDMGMRPNSSSGNPGRTHRFLDTSLVEPVWPFGFGLSFTDFRILFAKTPDQPVAADEQSQWVVEVQNVGSEYEGDVVVACYVSAPSHIKDAPRRSLFDFQRVEALKPGVSRLLAFELSAKQRALVTPEGRWATPAGDYSVHCEAGALVSTGVRVLSVLGPGTPLYS